MLGWPGFEIRNYNVCVCVCVCVWEGVGGCGVGFGESVGTCRGMKWGGVWRVYGMVGLGMVWGGRYGR